MSPVLMQILKKHFKLVRIGILLIIGIQNSLVLKFNVMQQMAWNLPVMKYLMFHQELRLVQQQEWRLCLHTVSPHRHSFPPHPHLCLNYRHLLLEIWPLYLQLRQHTVRSRHHTVALHQYTVPPHQQYSCLN